MMKEDLSNHGLDHLMIDAVSFRAPNEVGNVQGMLIHPVAQDVYAMNHYPLYHREPLIQLIDVVYHIAQAGYVHRDLRPSNILVQYDGNILLTDFESMVPQSADPIPYRGTSKYASSRILDDDGRDGNFPGDAMMIMIHW